MSVQCQYKYSVRGMKAEKIDTAEEQFLRERYVAINGVCESVEIGGRKHGWWAWKLNKR